MAAKSKSVGSNKAPLGSTPPRATKLARGRTDASTTPLEIRTQGVSVVPALDSYLRTRLGAKLGKFAIHIERVTARFEDINGPRGGIDTECRIQVTLVSRPTIVVSARGRDARRAFDAVLASVTQAVRRDLERVGYSERGVARAAKSAVSKSPSGKSAAEKPKSNDASAEPEPDSEPRTSQRPSRISTRRNRTGLRSGIGLQKRAQARTVSPKSKARAAEARGRGTR